MLIIGKYNILAQTLNLVTFTITHIFFFFNLQIIRHFLVNASFYTIIFIDVYQ